ncbi:hypothetical protein LguiA_032991 [Lonicera macranthoides]
MAMQAGFSFSKIIIIAGAGYTSTILLKNGKLSDILGELQSLAKGYQDKGEAANPDADVSDAIASQVRRLAMEVRQLASARQITVLNGSSGQMGKSLIVPTAVLGALGYGYMKWKGISFSDLMYVTKKNMATAVSNLTKHLEHVSDALAATKKHLTQRIENLDGKMDQQVEISKLIKSEVTDVRADLSTIGLDLDTLHRMVSGLDGKIMSIEEKQNLTNMGVLYLCNFVDGKTSKSAEILQLQEQLGSKSRGFLTSSETPSPKGLKDLFDVDVGNLPLTDGIVQDVSPRIDGPPRPLLRMASTKC